MEYVLYTFNSTSKAMASEMALKESKTPGRLVPILPEIDAGCGLALRIEIKFYKNMENIFKSNNLSYTDRYILVYEDGSRKAKVKKYDLL